jgi:hypothetical protein
MRLEQVVHRIATDAGFASAVRADLEGTLAREGIRLTADQVTALRAALLREPSRPSGASQLDVWHSPQFEPQNS